ncbi:MAG TPA: proteasome subunit alpha [Acidimicrobiales bacterium]|nr:proteasome subunit alpha [Acidimicrobiales bacterium]
MSMPFYVNPEQVMRDKADYARKNIARGRPLVGLKYADGIVIVAENASRSLHKVSEIYDRIAFAGVGLYNEFEQMRVAGVRHADTKGYAYSREDVDARALANVYGQYLHHVFTHELKPMEVEILVAEVGASGEEDRLFHIAYDGVVMDDDRCSVLGGDAESVAERLDPSWEENLSLEEAVRRAVAALAGPDREIGADALEVAYLSRTNGRRAFRRLQAEDLAAVLAST